MNTQEVTSKLIEEAIMAGMNTAMEWITESNEDVLDKAVLFSKAGGAQAVLESQVQDAIDNNIIVLSEDEY